MYYDAVRVRAYYVASLNPMPSERGISYVNVAVSFGLWGLGPIFLQSHCRPGVGRLLGIQRGAGGAVVGGAAAAAAAGWHLGGDRGQPLRRRCLFFFFSTLPERATNT